MPRTPLLCLCSVALLASLVGGCTPDAQEDCRALAKVMGRAGDDVFVAQKKHSETKDAASLAALAVEFEHGAAKIDKVEIKRPDLLGPRKDLAEAFRAGARAATAEKAARDKGDEAAALAAKQARRAATGARQKASAAVHGVCHLGSSSAGP